jgi:hypothetical protein
MAAPPDSDPAGPDAAKPALTIVPFEDGTGRIGIAPGWHAEKLGEGSAYLSRSDGAHVMLGVGVYLLDPNGSTYRTYQRMYAETRFVPAAGFLIPYEADPVRAFVAVNRAIAMQTGKPDPQTNVESSQPLAPVPGGAAAYIDATAIPSSTPMRIRGNVVAMTPSSDGGWSVTVNLVSAPEATFQQDAPVLLAMFNSYVLDVEARRKQVAGAQSASAAKVAEHNENVFNTSMAGAHAAQTRIDKSANDFIRGTFHPDG